MLVDLTKIISGFSEKLRVVTFFVAVVLLKKKKKNLGIIDKKTTECPYFFRDYLKIKGFSSYKSKLNQNDNLIKINTYNSFPNLKNCILHNQFNLNNDRLLKKWKSCYKLLTPNSVIQKKIKLLKLPKSYLSIHLRSTDRLVNLKYFLKKIDHKDIILNAQLNFFQKNIVRIINKYSNIKNIFISSDDLILKKKLINILIKNNFNVYYNRIPYKKRFRQTSGKDFITDLFCLAKSRLIISTTGGGVTYTAGLINEKIKIIKFINEINIFYILRIFFLSIYYLKRIKSKLINLNKTN